MPVDNAVKHKKNQQLTRLPPLILESCKIIYMVGTKPINTTENTSLWMESSAKERQLADLVADEFFSLEAKGHPLEKSFTELILTLLASRGTLGIIRKIVEKHPDLNFVNFKKAAPENEEDLSSNFVSCLALAIRSRTNPLPQKGVVLTPFYLAKEMVRASSKFWLNEFSVDEKPKKSSTDRIFQTLELATWFDPCVGGGVFPIAILSYLISLGAPLNKELATRISGSDIDPLYVLATKIRIAAFLSKNNAGSYSEIFRILDSKFTVKNTLLRNSEQGTIDTFDTKEKRPDIVIGNPPYIRADKIPKNEKLLLKSLYPTSFSGASDLYVYFIANGLNTLNPNGILCFVSPAAFQKSRYGSGIRGYIQKNGKVRALFDFDELPVFQGIGAHISVYIIAKSQLQRKIYARSYKNLPVQTEELFQNFEKLPDGNITSEGWSSSTGDVDTFLQKIRKNSVALKDYVQKGIYSGLKTGHQKAYILDEYTAEAFLSDDKTKEFIKPLIKPKDISRWGSRNPAKKFYLVVIKKGSIIPDDSLLMQHLLKYKNELVKRTDSHYSSWYALRDCSYYNLFEEKKIIYPDISKHSRFMIDEDGTYLTDGAFFIPVDDYFLLGLLNSSLAFGYFKIKCTSIGNPENRGRLRFKKVYVEDFPVRKPTAANQKIRECIGIEARALTMGSGNQFVLDRLVQELYDDCVL